MQWKYNGNKYRNTVEIKWNKFCFMENKKYIALQNLEVYRLSRKLSSLAWEIYDAMNWQIKKIIGDQFITSTDSVGANIAEGYARFHYLDKIRFYYNSRGSLSECSDHWIELLYERGYATRLQLSVFKQTAKTISVKLNNFISSTYKTKFNQK